MNKEQTWQVLTDLNVAKGEMPAEKWKLNGAKLRGAKLPEADLFSADLSGADLRDSDLSGADLRVANLRYANLSGADLAGAHLNSSNLHRAKLPNAHLSGSNLQGAKLTGATLVSADFSGTKLNGANFINANLRGALFINANLTSAKLDGADLSDGTLTSANLSRSRCLETKLCRCILRDAILVDVNFNLADLSDADLTGTCLWGISSAGWLIKGIKAEYIYCTRDVANKTSMLRTFLPGQFETLYSSLPTIEMLFDGGLTPAKLYILNATIEDLNRRNPHYGLKMVEASVHDFQTRVGVQVSSNNYLSEAASLIRHDLAQLNKSVPQASALQYYSQLLTELTGQSLPVPLLGAVAENLPNPIIMNNPIFNRPVFNLLKSDGSSVISQTDNFKIISSASSVFNQYIDNKDQVENLFQELKIALSDLTVSNAQAFGNLADQLIAVLREGKDQSLVKELFSDFKEGIKTGGSIASIVSAIFNILKISLQ